MCYGSINVGEIQGDQGHLPDEHHSCEFQPTGDSRYSYYLLLSRKLESLLVITLEEILLSTLSKEIMRRWWVISDLSSSGMSTLSATSKAGQGRSKAHVVALGSSGPPCMARHLDLALTSVLLSSPLTPLHVRLGSFRLSSDGGYGGLANTWLGLATGVNAGVTVRGLLGADEMAKPLLAKSHLVNLKGLPRKDAIFLALSLTIFLLWKSCLHRVKTWFPKMVLLS